MPWCLAGGFTSKYDLQNHIVCAHHPLSAGGSIICPICNVTVSDLCNVNTHTSSSAHKDNEMIMKMKGLPVPEFSYGILIDFMAQYDQAFKVVCTPHQSHMTYRQNELETQKKEKKKQSASASSSSSSSSNSSPVITDLMHNYVKPRGKKISNIIFIVNL